MRGKVQMPNGDSVSGVLVQAMQDENEIAKARTDSKGEFQLAGLKPGVYSFVFNKDGLAEGRLPRMEIEAGKIMKLTKLVMSVDEGRFAQIRGSVFDAKGRIVPGAKVEVFRVGSNQKLFERYASSVGEFSFKLPGEEARYRIQVTSGNSTGSKEFVFSGGQVFRVAISLN